MRVVPVRSFKEVEEQLVVISAQNHPVLTDIAATCFHPRPKVASSIVEIRFKVNPEFPARDEALLFRVVRAAFGKRRKTLKNALTQSDLRLDGVAVIGWLEGCAIDPRRRAETLSVGEYVTLANRFPRKPDVI